MRPNYFLPTVINTIAKKIKTKETTITVQNEYMHPEQWPFINNPNQRANPNRKIKFTVHLKAVTEVGSHQ